MKTRFALAVLVAVSLFSFSATFAFAEKEKESINKKVDIQVAWKPFVSDVSGYYLYIGKDPNPPFVEGRIDLRLGFLGDGYLVAPISIEPGFHCFALTAYRDGAETNYTEPVCFDVPEDVKSWPGPVVISIGQ